MRVTVGTNVWRKVEGVMGDRRLSHKLKANDRHTKYTMYDGTNRETQ